MAAFIALQVLQHNKSNRRISKQRIGWNRQIGNVWEGDRRVESRSQSLVVVRTEEVVQLGCYGTSVAIICQFCCESDVRKQPGKNLGTTT